MSNKFLTIGLVVALAIALLGVFTPQGKATFGQITDTFSGDIFDAVTSYKIGGVTILDASTLKTTTAGGTLTVTTSNSATSTGSIGCIQTVATSTATPIHLAPSTASLTATTTFAGSATGGYLIWAFGACPL